MESPSKQEIEDVERLNRALDNRVVKRLLDQIAERDATIAALERWSLVLFGAFFVLLLAPDLVAALRFGRYLVAG